MGDRLRLYRMMPHQDGDWQILVVAHTAKEAKGLGWPVLRCTNPAQIPEYVDCRVRLVPQVGIPRDVAGPVVIDHCDEAPWTCPAWSHEECPRTCPQFKPEYEEE